MPDQPSLAQVLKSGRGAQPILSQREAAQRMRSMLPSDDDKVRNLQTLGQVLLEMTGVPSVQRFLQGGYVPGRLSANDAAAIEEAFNAAGAATVGGLAAPKPRGSIGASGGRRALDMSPKARMERADELMRPETVFHGTHSPEDFMAFDLQYGGGRSGSRAGAQGVSVAVDPAVADEFARGAQGATLEHSRVLPLRYRSDKQARLTLDGTEQNNEVAATLAHAWDLGYDSVRLMNYTTPGGSGGHQVIIVRNPNQLRSTSAAFDPAEVDSANLLAANRVPVVLPKDDE